MRTQSAITRAAIALCCIFAAAAAFGQTTFTWTNSAGGDLAGNTNWDPNGVPNPDDPSSQTPGAGDQILFNGSASGVFTNVCQTGVLIGASGSTVGLYVHLTAGQASPVTFISSTGLGGAFRLQSITNDAGAGGITIGDNGTGNTFNSLWGGINGQVHQLRNDSVNPCTINSGMEIRFGGGGTHTFTFDGSGDWHVTNDMNNASASVSQVTKNGTGTMVWYSTNNPNLQHNGNFGIGNGVFINGGKLILKTSDSFRSPNIGQRGIIDNAYLEYDDINPAGGGTLSGVISGTGALQVNSGALTLSGQNTYTGSNILSGGELVAGGPESAGSYGPLGVGGTISLIGGTFGYNANNAFDYSSRFDSAANQQYNIDTGGQFVFFAAPLASSGGSLIKSGAGVLTLTGAASYSGPTTVTSGKLVFQGAMSGTGSIKVTDGSALGVFNNGTAVSPGTLTLGGSSGTTLEFNNLTSTTTAPLNAGMLVSGGTQVININSGAFTVGNSYPLLTWSAGNAPAVQLGLLNRFIGNLSTNGNAIQLNIVAGALSWTGLTNGNWDATTPGNWKSGGSPAIWQNGEPALFDDTATGTTTVTVNSPVSPSSTTVSNSSLSYSIASSGANNIGGAGGLLKSGTNILTLSGGANNYTGVTTINGGILSVSQLANGGSASDIGAANNSPGSLVLNGGTLQYTGNTASMNRLFTIGAFGGTIDNEGPGTLTLNNTGTIAMTDSGARVLTLTGANANGDTLASTLHDGSGATSLLKQGTCTWILTGTNAYSGGTTISNGTLQVGNGGSTGAIGSGGCVDNAALVFNRTGTVTVFGAVNGSGSVTQSGTGTVILAGDNGYTNGTTINSGTLQVGNGGPTGSLYTFGSIVDNGTLIFNSTGAQFYYPLYNDIITGTGNVIVRTGKVILLSDNAYTGSTEIDSGAIFQPTMGLVGQLFSSVVNNNNGTLLFERSDFGVFGYAGDIFGTGKIMQDNNNDNVGGSTLTGTNFSTGGLLIAGGYIILGDNANPLFGSMASLGDIVFTNSAVNDGNPRGLILNRPDNFTFSNNIVGKTVIISGGTGNPGALILMGSATVTLIGSNTYQGGTIISNGVLVVGKGGATGSIGTGPINDQTSLTFNRSGTLNVPGNFSGPGTVAMVGSGVVNLTGFYSGLSGSTAVSNGVLGANSIGGDVDVVGGTLAVGGYQTVGTLAIGNSTVSPAVAANLNISSGTVSMALNTALAQSNSFVQMTVTNILTTLTFNGSNGYTTNITVTSATGAIHYTGGTLQLINVGPTLAVGDRFVLFSEPIPGGMPIATLGNFSVANNLAVDGSVTVTAVAQPPPAKINKTTLNTNGVAITITATNNFGPGGSWDLLATNSIAAPITTWPIIMSGNFDANGNATLNLTNFYGGDPSLFFNLRTP